MQNTENLEAFASELTKVVIDSNDDIQLRNIDSVHAMHEVIMDNLDTKNVDWRNKITGYNPRTFVLREFVRSNIDMYHKFCDIYSSSAAVPKYPVVSYDTSCILRAKELVDLKFKYDSEQKVIKCKYTILTLNNTTSTFIKTFDDGIDVIDFLAFVNHNYNYDASHIVDEYNCNSLQEDAIRDLFAHATIRTAKDVFEEIKNKKTENVSLSSTVITRK